jgi:hypothetical protein
MGLVEKRISAAMQKENFPAWKKSVLETCDAKLEFEVAWDELVKEGYGDYYPKNVEYNFFAPLTKALESVCADDLGTEAFKEKVKKVHIGSKRGWSSLEAKVENNTLYLDSDPSYGKTKDDCEDYAKRIQHAIEAAL